MSRQEIKTHSFRKEDAKKYGVNKALMLHHIRWHIENNVDEDLFKKEGHYWAYAKRSMLEKKYPYFTGSSMSRWLRELEDEGVIESCKPQSSFGQHTKFYRIICSEGNGQNEQSNGEYDHSWNDQNDHSSINNYTSKYKVHSSDKWDTDQPIDYQSFIDYFNDLYDQRRKNTDTKKEQIRARLRTFTGNEIKKSWNNRLHNDWVKENGFLGDWYSAMRSDERVDKWLNKQQPEPKQTVQSGYQAFD